MSELQSFDFELECFECENDDITFRDDFGSKVMYAAALEDLEAPEQEIMLIGSYHIRKEGKADRAGVLHDPYAAEVMFNVEKRRLVEVYLKRYQIGSGGELLHRGHFRASVSAPTSDSRRQNRLHRWVPSGNRIHLGGTVWIHLHT